MNKQWNKFMLSDKFVICDNEYINKIDNIYLSHFLNECKHYFIDNKYNEEALKSILDNHKNYKIILFNLSDNKIKNWIKNNYKTYDCQNDINIFSIEMSLMPVKEYDLAHKLCKTVVEYLNKNDIYYYATGGTKIGILRNNNLLPWDWDIDFTIMVNKKTILTDEFKQYLFKNNILILDCLPLKKDFKLNFGDGDLNFYIDMICLDENNHKKYTDNTEKTICSSYYVKVEKDSKLIWKDWKEYIESAYFYCCVVYNYMGPTKYKTEGVKLYEELTYKNKFKIDDYKYYLSSVFERY